MNTAPHPQLALLQEAISAALAGDKTAARRLLEQLTTSYTENELAWLWLASVSTLPQEIIRCWRRVIKINPHQEQAVQGLKRLLLQEGVTTAKNGHKEEARELLLELTALDPNNEVAWLWLATLAKDREEATRYTLRVLRINPNNDRAKAWIDKLQPQATVATTVAPATISSAPPKILSSSTWNYPFCGTEALHASPHCSYCRAVVSLTNLDEVLNNKEVHLPLITAAVQRLEMQVEAAGEQADHASLFNLGLGYLNLSRFDEGAKYLRRAAELKLKDARLKTQVENLLQRVSESALAAEAAVNAAHEATLTPLAETAPIETSGSYTILMVDDSPTIRKLVSMTLEKYGHQVICASNGLDALNKLKEVMPDLILSDITMPHMDGYQLCKMIRSNSIMKSVPVIMLSGKDGIFDKLRGRMVGATAYITKPFEIDSLLQLIDMHCQESAQRI